MSDFELNTIRPYIDVACYVAEARRAGIFVDVQADCAAHFCTTGWKKGIDPSRWFSVKDYLSMYPDVKAAGVNPFYHYLVAGKSEGRLARTDSAVGGAEASILKGLRSLEEDSIGWYREQVMPKEVLGIDALNDAFQDARTLGAAPDACRFAMSFSHDNFLVSPGGMQVCINHELKCARVAGFSYVHVFPYQPQPRLGGFGVRSRYWGISLNGRMLGFAAQNDIIQALRMAGALHAVVVHSLLGFNEHDVLRVCKELAPGHKIYWAHDYFTFCESWTLTRNKLVHCDSPPLASAECALCYFGDSREVHVRRMRSFLRSFRPHVICPSEAARRRFVEFSNKLEYVTLGTHVLPHFSLSEWGVRHKSHSGKVKVAFLGHPAFHKGWSTFMNVFRDPGLPTGVQFFHFGEKETEIGHGLFFEKVNTSVDGPDAMARAIRKHDIDFCLVRPEWPETFGITALEAIVGGARVITCSNSGGVLENLAPTGFCEALDSVAEIVNRLVELVEHPQLYDSLDFPENVILQKSRMSFDVMR